MIKRNPLLNKDLMESYVVLSPMHLNPLKFKYPKILSFHFSNTFLIKISIDKKQKSNF